MRQKRLPEGLLEFEGSLYGLDYASRLLPRLADLPESNFTDELSRFDAAMKEVARIEEQLSAAREKARQIALKTWKSAVKNWTVAELQAATGYDEN